MKIFAVDQASSCGWCFSDGEQLTAGLWDLSIHKGETNGKRLLRFWRRLEMAWTMYGGFDVLVCERVGHLKGHANRVLPALLGVLELWAEMKLVPLEIYSAKEVKKFATGDGNANKEKMLEFAVRKWKGLCIIDHNMADALWLLDFAKEQRK